MLSAASAKKIAKEYDIRRYFRVIEQAANDGKFNCTFGRYYFSIDEEKKLPIDSLIELIITDSMKIQLKNLGFSFEIKEDFHIDNENGYIELIISWE